MDDTQNRAGGAPAPSPASAGEVLADATVVLAEAGVPTPRVDAELLLRHVVGWSASQLVLGANEALMPADVAVFRRLIERRVAREPLQLIVGSVGFRHLDVEVRPGVFIPRPETEVLAGEAIARVPYGGLVLEPCTGTGVIACAVATESTAATVVATDSSADAVALARSNARRTGAEVTVLLGDLLDPVSPDVRGRVDVLVCNPPYIAAGELDAVEPEVVDWDPMPALIAGATGHEVTDRLIAAAPQWLAAGGWLLLEVDSSRAEQTARRAAAAGLQCVEVLRDLTGADRFVVGRR